VIRAFDVVAVAGVATIQDGGRPGYMHQGVPHGGALVPELLARANAAVGNAHGDAGVEVIGTLTLRACAAIRVSADDGAAVQLDEGAVWTVASRGARVAYAASRGGFAAPVVVGGRGTLLAAAFGGHEGRALRKGDMLAMDERPAVVSVAPPAAPVWDASAPIRVVAGPDRERFGPTAFDELVASEFRVSPRSDRIGVRLVGPALDRVGDDSGVSAPMVRGAIQVPGSGEPIVLGPDHPTMGGYPVVATVVRADLGRLMARPVGAPVRFAWAVPRRRGGLGYET
jgi:biotin-dependent carboxylase-like uncharacterized protein